jgi:flagellar basal body P-ring protein FlgI
MGPFQVSSCMKTYKKKEGFVKCILLIGLFIAGCGKPFKTTKEPNEPATKIDVGTTIDSLAEVFAPELIAVEGYGLIGGLNGTGSAECPPRIRAYLKQYILQKLPERRIDVDSFISSRDTAVVVVEGRLPTTASKNQYFDVIVFALPGTQTTSLEGGWLYGADLKAAGGFGVTIKVLATAEGPIFMDTIASYVIDKKMGYILAGATVLDEYGINLALRQPNYRIASIIRNKLNGRFGDGTAKATSPGQIELKVPAEYKEQKQRFISIVKAMYLAEAPEITEERINTFVGKLAASEDKHASEAALEAIGKKSLDKLATLLNSSNEEVRLSAARCMLNMGNDQGLEVLRQIAMDKDSTRRIEALEAITASASRNDAAAVSRKLLRDENFDIRLAAYEQLRKLDDIAVTKRLIARDFYLEEIAQTEDKAIFVSRSGQPRIVLFGAPIYCRDNIFVQSADGNITINAPTGQKYVSIIRKHPQRPNVIIKVESSFELSRIIRTLCEEPSKKTSQGQPGLGISYAELIALLKQMCDKSAVQAQFHAGPLPKFGTIVKK